MSIYGNSFEKSPYLDDINWRFEYKYCLTFPQYLSIRNAIKPYMYFDEYTIASNKRKYFVRSLYFDSFLLDAFNDKADGNSDRLKLRIRTYKPSPEDVDTLKAEIKVRKNVTTEKYIGLISFRDYEYFMKHRHWPNNVSDDVVLNEFERYVHLKNQFPKVLVQYEREGLRARNREEIRITFDHNVSSTKSDVLFPKSPIFRKHFPGFVILEIKCDKQQPDWLHKLVQNYGLRIISNSKYSQGIIYSLPTVTTPSWSG
jgi:hypothetical protein